MCTVYDAMIACESEYHHGLHRWLTVDGHNAFRDAAYSQNSSLWLIDDGIERVNVVHAQVADGESAIADVLQPKFSVLCLCQQFPTLLSNRCQTECICMVDHWNHQSILNGYCQPDMYCLLQRYFALAPRSVNTRMHM